MGRGVLVGRILAMGRFDLPPTRLLAGVDSTRLLADVDSTKHKRRFYLKLFFGFLEKNIKTRRDTRKPTYMYFVYLDIQIVLSTKAGFTGSYYSGS
jgi:hypothetical protein